MVQDLAVDHPSHPLTYSGLSLRAEPDTIHTVARTLIRTIRRVVRLGVGTTCYTQCDQGNCTNHHPFAESEKG